MFSHVPSRNGHVFLQCTHLKNLPRAGECENSSSPLWQLWELISAKGFICWFMSVSNLCRLFWPEILLWRKPVTKSCVDWILIRSLFLNMSPCLKTTASSGVLMYMVESFKVFQQCSSLIQRRFLMPATLISLLREEMSYGCCIRFCLLAISPLHTVCAAQSTRGVFLGDLPQASRPSCVPHYLGLSQEPVSLWPCSQGGTVCLHWRLCCPYFPLWIQWWNCLQNVFSI